MSTCRGIARRTPHLLRNGFLSKFCIRQPPPLSDIGKITVQIRSYRSSDSLLAAKKGKSTAAGADIVLPDTKDLDSQMDKKLTRVVDEFAKLRNGQPNTELFRTIMVNSNGARVSVADSGQLSVKSPVKMSITVFDPSQVNSVAEAIRECGMGLNPMVEGSSINMSIPKPSKESRDALIKTAKMIADKGKQDVRQLRKEGMDLTKKLKGSIGEDDIKRYTKDIDALMDKKLEKITKLMKDKEAELLR